MLLKLAYGEMGMSVTDLAGFTPYWFEFKIEGFRNQNKRLESDFRRLGWLTFKMQADPKTTRHYTLDMVWPSVYAQLDLAQNPKVLFDKKKINQWAKIIQNRKNKT